MWTHTIPISASRTMADILQRDMNLPQNIPKVLSDRVEVMATAFSAILRENLVGIYLWGSLTYQAFVEVCINVDCIGVTRRAHDDRGLFVLAYWFRRES